MTATLRLTLGQIYATVGNETKVNYLMETYGLARDRIYHSRNTSFQTDLMQATAGRGVDIVLNSLSGNLLHASWQCVAKFGRMIELGKRDFISHGVLDMSIFESNRSFIGVDLAQVGREAPQVLKRLVSSGAVPTHTDNWQHVNNIFRLVSSGFDPSYPSRESIRSSRHCQCIPVYASRYSSW